MLNKKTIGIVLLFIFIGICFLSNVGSNPMTKELPVNNDIITSNGHGSYGVRGRPVLDFDSPYPEGLGYTYEENLINIQKMFGEGK